MTGYERHLAEEKAKELLRDSLEAINNSYQGLTEAERRVLTEDDFNNLLNWIRE